MTHRRIKLAAVAAASALLLAIPGGTPAEAGRRRDLIPPTAPVIVYAQGFFCFTFYLGAMRSSDNVSPEHLLRYEVFANDQFIGLLDTGSDTTAWGDLKLIDEGPNQVYVEAVDAAGNRARSGTATVTGFDCEL